MAINEAGRKKLHITAVKEKRTVGNAEVLDFIAKIEGEESAVKYGAWSKALYDYIKADTVIVADVEVKKSEKVDPDGNPYINRKITQVYVDGNGVVTEKKGTFLPRGETPEKLRSYALSYAKDLAVPIVAATGQFPFNLALKVVKVADVFRRWLDGEDTATVIAHIQTFIDEVKREANTPQAGAVQTKPKAPPPSQ